MKQVEALALLDAGYSLLITGAAGTGKTYVLNEFIRRSKRRGKSIAVTATTGLAATHLSGTTIHAWSGIGIHDSLASNHHKNLSKQRQETIRRADILIIDEISMLHDFRLDMVDEITRGVRESEKPFGGLQVILSGDFFQLPPVNRGAGQGNFVVSSQVWEQGAFQVAYLEEQFRQAEDEDYTNILNGIRAGQLSRRQLDMLLARQDAIQDPWAAHTRLLTTNADVDTINARHLIELEGETHEFEMTTTGSAQYVEQLTRSCLAPPLLELKIGARVMCIKNSPDRRYANGSLGVVQAFDTDTGYPIIELVNGRVVAISPETWELMDGERRRASLTQLPLRLAWAITVHKSQGMTLDAARIDLSRAFVEGMGYVALSRVRGLEHLTLDGINNMALRTSPVARELDRDLRERSRRLAETQQDLINDWIARSAEAAQSPADGEGQGDEIDYDPVVFERLRLWRSEEARTRAVPPYLIAHDKLLALIATRKPQTLEELSRVKGMGKKKLDEFGEALLAQVRTA